ncbi:MAG: carbohydrate porin [Polyangiaceae bacterium]
MRLSAASAGIAIALSTSLAAWAQAPAPTDSPPPDPPPTTPDASATPADPPPDSAPASDPPPADKPVAGDAAKAPPPPDKPREPAPEQSTFSKVMSGFSYGSYGRVVGASDFRGRPGRDTDFVAFGSRLDETNYVELELRREDYWEKTKSFTRIVTTLAMENPIFHYSGNFDATIAIRNMFIEERDLGVKRLSVWAGSRMYRGDDIYLLNFWPLDNLNTLGGGARYAFDEKGWTSLAIHAGVNRPTGLFYYQTSERTAPLNAFGAQTVEILNRQRTIGSLKLSHIFPVGEKGGIKGVLYSEVHGLSAGQREVDPEVFEDLPAENGLVVGAQLGAFTGSRDTHLNLFFRYARGLAAYGEWGTPTRLALDRTSGEASEIRAAFGGNFEAGPFGLMAGGYFRSFRNGSVSLDVEDFDEGCLIVRPHLFFGEWGGLSLEGSFQAQQRGALTAPAPTDGGLTGAPTGFASGTMWRFGVIPFLSPAGRGDFVRPHIRLIYVVSVRDDGAKALYPKDDVFGIRDVDHFLGFGAEWWFNSSSYGW